MTSFLKYWLDQLSLTCQIRYLGHETLVTLKKSNNFFLLNTILNQPNDEG